MIDNNEIDKFIKGLTHHHKDPFFDNKNDIINWLDSMNIQNYTINDNLTVNVHGSVDISYKKLSYFPVQFNRIGGDFDCSHNELTSLKRFPKVVQGKLSCSYNEISYFFAHSMIVVRDFYCSNNGLLSLRNLPNIMNSLDCSNNKLTSLIFCPKKINGDFFCYYNNLESFDHLPDFIGGVFEHDAIPALNIKQQDNLQTLKSISLYNKLQNEIKNENNKKPNLRKI